MSEAKNLLKEIDQADTFPRAVKLIFDSQLPDGEFQAEYVEKLFQSWNKAVKKFYSSQCQDFGAWLKTGYELLLGRNDGQVNPIAQGLKERYKTAFRRYKKPNKCPACSGEGLVDNEDSFGHEVCPKCNGTGIRDDGYIVFFPGEEPGAVKVIGNQEISPHSPENLEVAQVKYMTDFQPSPKEGSGYNPQPLDNCPKAEPIHSHKEPERREITKIPMEIPQKFLKKAVIGKDSLQHRPFSLLCPSCGATDTFSFEYKKQKGKENKLVIACDICQSELVPDKHYKGNAKRILLILLNEELYSQKEEKKPCPVCGGLKLWESVSGKVICEICHPPATEKIVARRFKVKGFEKKNPGEEPGQLPTARVIPLHKRAVA